MRMHDDYEGHNGMSPMVVSALVAVTLCVGAILAIVLLVNNPTENRKSTVASQQTEHTVPPDSGVISTEEPMSTGTLLPGDLDFWDKYPQATPVASEPPKAEATPKPEDNDPSRDGKHTLVKTAEGKEEWLLISPYLPKHEYDFTKLVCQSNQMQYYEDGVLVSYVGADISKYQDYVDFVKLKKAGIDFVMLRVGARGYGSGQIVMDDYFLDNIKRATDAGLQVGVYFFSQAITEDEAREEANIVLESIKDYKITYPVAFDMEYIENDTARVETLSKSDKTKITKAFLDTVKAAGYKAMIYGKKEWLLKEIDMSKLTAYDVWLSQLQDIPDYPYQFTMWQYTNTATVDGVAGYVDLNISFIDYAEK